LFLSTFTYNSLYCLSEKGQLWGIRKRFSKYSKCNSFCRAEFCVSGCCLFFSNYKIS